MKSIKPLTRKARKQMIAVSVGTRKVMTVASEMFKNESESGGKSGQRSLFYTKRRELRPTV